MIEASADADRRSRSSGIIYLGGLAIREVAISLDTMGRPQEV
jgi:hypothetical protein